jgi:dTDP-4-amino-4,6-dideoxy-D-glucose acyltransferase
LELYDLDLLSKYGEDVYVSSSVEIRRPKLVEIGSHVAIDSGFYLTTKARIGSYIHIGPYVTCIGGADATLIMDDFSTIAAGARLIVRGDEHLGEGLVGPTIPEPFKDNLIGGSIKIEKFANVGTNAIVMPGLTLREGSVLGAGSLLTNDTEPWTIYIGMPAKAIKVRNKEKMISFAARLTPVL